MRKPASLRKGDVVRIIAPASPFSRRKFDAGVIILKEFGLRPVWREDLFVGSDYLAGDDRRRALELREAFMDPDAAAVFPARGGFGCARTCVAAGEPEGFRDRLLVGFSDITTLHSYLNRFGLVTVHGPNVTTLPMLEPAGLEQYRRTIFGIEPVSTFRWDGLACVSPGRVSGRILAANLTVLVSLAGTALMPELDGRILVLEDLNEKPYRLDRMLFQLCSQPGFDKVVGVVFGDFMLDSEDAGLFARTVGAFAHQWGVPVVTGFPSGHGLANDCIGSGVPAFLDAVAGRLEAESPVF